MVDHGTVYVGSDDGNIYAIGGGSLLAPVAGFTATPRSGTSSLLVQFTDTSLVTGGIMWNWSFGDGSWLNTTTSTNPSHTYNTPGIYDVTLRVTNASGSSTATRAGYIHVTSGGSGNAIGMQINLGKTYTFKNVSISSINAIDLSDPSVSQVMIASTVGDRPDLQTIHGPQINQVTRNFVTTTGTFDGVTVNITGSTSLPVSWATKPDYQIYTHPVVPTLDITVPGMTGNPIITKYNQSWTKGDLTSMSSLFQSSGDIYMYKDGGALNINPATNTYTAVPVEAWVYNKSDFGSTLNANAVSLAPFIGNSSVSSLMGNAYPTTLPAPGKYYASAVSYDSTAHALNLSALSPVVILNGRTPIQWTNISGPTGHPVHVYHRIRSDC